MHQALPHFSGMTVTIGWQQPCCQCAPPLRQRACGSVPSTQGTEGARHSQAKPGRQKCGCASLMHLRMQCNSTNRSCTTRAMITPKGDRSRCCCSRSSRSSGVVSDSSSSSSSSGVASGSGGRRQLLLRSTLLPSLLLIGSDDATTIVNSILSGYGLPTLKPTQGFKAYDEFEDDYMFEYPRSWVARRNSLRQGVYIADFQTADKVSVEVLDAPADGDITTAAVSAAVIPPGRQEDDTLNLPAKRLIKSAAADVDGQEYLYLEFPSETTTRSGYNIKRKNFVAAGVKRGKLYVLAASARSDQYNPEKRDALQHIVQSFRLR